MCKCLNLPRSTYYFIRHSPASKRKSDLAVEQAVVTSFMQSRRAYGTRRIRFDIKSAGITASRRRIAAVMRKFSLVSKYTKAHFKPRKASCNEYKLPNILSRDFDSHAPMTAVVSDLTYVRVGDKWNYICILLDLCRREIVGYSVGEHKDHKLVAQAFASVKGDLSQIRLFHTDRGSEFKNIDIDTLLQTFGIERSLSMKGCPYDNAVAEATFKTIKTEFVHGEVFDNIGQLRVKFTDYVNWFNTRRLHSHLDYQSPASFTGS